jgi:hypothetical protein
VGLHRKKDHFKLLDELRKGFLEKVTFKFQRWVGVHQAKKGKEFQAKKTAHAKAERREKPGIFEVL